MKIREKGSGVEGQGKSQQRQLVPMVTTRWQHQLGCCLSKCKEKAQPTATGAFCASFRLGTCLTENIFRKPIKYNQIQSLILTTSFQIIQGASSETV